MTTTPASALDSLGRRVGDGPMVRHGFAELTGLARGLAVGLSRMPLAAPQWRTPMEVGTDHHVVYSYVTQRVDFDGLGPMVVTPNEVLVCPAATVYRRCRTFRDEEVTVFIAVHPEVADQMGSADELARGVVSLDAVPGRLSFAAWQLAHDLRHAEPVPLTDLEYTERAAHLLAPLATIVARAGRADPAAAAPKSRARRQHGALVDAVREQLAHSYSDRSLPLAALARDVGASPFHLTRVFRRVTGRSIHQYRTQLRLRSVLLQLPECVSLADLAIATGFASHSHLSDAFRRHFDASPARVRAQLRGQRKPLRGGATRCDDWPSAQVPYWQGRCLSDEEPGGRAPWSRGCLQLRQVSRGGGCGRG